MHPFSTFPNAPFLNAPSPNAPFLTLCLPFPMRMG